jgi:hypothetical protein
VFPLFCGRKLKIVRAAYAAEGPIHVYSGGNCIIYATDRINSTIKIKPPSTSFVITEQPPAEWSFHFILLNNNPICDVFICVDFGGGLILVYNYYRIALSHKAMMLERDRF